MAKSIFRGNETVPGNGIIQVQLSKIFENKVEEVVVEEVPADEFPKIEDIKNEVEEFKAKWEIEKAEMIESAKKEADEILNSAKSTAEEEVRQLSEEAQSTAKKAQEEAEAIIAEAKRKAEEIIAGAEKEKDSVEKESFEKGFAEGREAGFKEGESEVNRLIGRVHLIIEKIMDKRQEILASTEQQVVDLVLLMVRKVVKVISENQRNVVLSNVVHALRKVKGRGDVVIRVNMADAALTTEHIKTFLSNVEAVKNITVVEDLSTDPGGCIVETDFGSIDARISSQLHELEQKILEVTPIKTKPKAVRN